ncbi:MAG: M48 family metalloprotease [Oscillatoria sp. SIO1A7]|nr:M48 family metalloprotease [Oscillatoria sp. SIO1A7]
MGLVRAYYHSGKTEDAIALCEKLAGSENPKLKAWAQKSLQSWQVLNERKGAKKENKEAIASAPASSAPTSSATPEASTPIYLEKPASEEESYEQEQEDELDSESETDLIVPGELLQGGRKALKEKRYAEAVQQLEEFCQRSEETHSDFAQARMWLVKAYRGNAQLSEAIALCEELADSSDTLVRDWVKQTLPSLKASGRKASGKKAPTPEPIAAPDPESPEEEQPKAIPKAGRSPQMGVRLAMKGIAGSLALASTVTISLLFGMVLVLSLALILIVGSDNPGTGLQMSIAITIAVNLGMFFLSPWIMDFIQGGLYRTRWVSLKEIERYSPESAEVIRQVCARKKLKHPKLGIIDDDNPTAFTYGSLPNTARIVVSNGIFVYLDDDEAATVYAHELGHIVHWDFAVMTLASTLLQIIYLIYIYTRELADQLGNGDAEKKIKQAARNAALLAYIFYIIGNYLLLYLSRTREYFADRFSAEATGNPNGLSRALVKIAYGILEEAKETAQPSKLIQGTRALGIADSKAAASIGTAYRIASEPEKIGRVFLWDMFNPWGWWMELNSTHPLTGKRVRALSTYAEQLGLDVEFDMGRIIGEGRKLNRKKLYGDFVFDIFIYWIQWIGAIVGAVLGFILYSLSRGLMSPAMVSAFATLGFGIATLIKILVAFPQFKRLPKTDVLTLMSDPYASPMRGKPAKIEGKVIGRGDAGYAFGSDMKFQDPAGTIYLRYASRFGPLGNFLFGWTQVESLVGLEGGAVGWFRRGIVPWIDLSELKGDNRRITSHHRFWLGIVGCGAIVLGLLQAFMS